MYVYNEIFTTPYAMQAFNINVKHFSEDALRYICSVSVEKKLPMQKVFEVLFDKVIGDCNLVMSSNYILTADPSAFKDK